MYMYCTCACIHVHAAVYMYVQVPQAMFLCRIVKQRRQCGVGYYEVQWKKSTEISAEGERDEGIGGATCTRIT